MFPEKLGDLGDDEVLVDRGPRRFEDVAPLDPHRVRNAVLPRALGNRLGRDPEHRPQPMHAVDDEQKDEGRQVRGGGQVECADG
jgi:hypothetical protein